MVYLITGANGFIGHALCKELLSLKHKVYAVVIDEASMDDLRCENLVVIKAFFEDYHIIPKLVKESLDVVVHLAWEGLSGSKAANVSIQCKNVVMAVSLISDLQASVGIKRVILASTMNKYEVLKNVSCPDNVSFRNVSVHVAAKINAEVCLRVFCQNNNILFNDAVIAMAYGENNKSKMIVNIFISKLLKGEEPCLVSGNNQYDIIYIDDIVTGIIAISQYGKDKKSYYIGHKWNKTFKEIFVEIGRIINPSISLKFGVYQEDNSIDFSMINRLSLYEDTNWEPKSSFENSILKTAEWIEKSWLFE